MSSVRSIPVQSQLPVTQLYRKLEIVGKGAYGSVHRGIHIPTGDVVALKIINLDTPDDDVEDIQREVALLSQLRGPGTNNITKYYGCYLDGPRVWIVMDFASGGSVRTLMKATKSNIIEERYSVVIIRELLVALAYLHKSGVIHRDIKAANILVTDQGGVLLCDFGVSALLPTTQSKRTTFIGTPYWMAPEVITSGSLYDAKADVWSLGITLYEMATGSPPHSNQMEMRVLALIPNTKPPRLAESEGSKDMREFLASCLKELPGERATAEELSKAKWIKNAKAPVSILKELILKYDAWSRAGGVRKSLLNDDFGEDDNIIRTGVRESIWEFDTVRARSSSIDLSSFAPDPDDSTQTPGRDDMSLPRVAPRSLRMLFEDADNPNAGMDAFRIQPLSRITTPVPPSSTHHSPVDIPGSSDKTIKQPPSQSPPPESSSSPPIPVSTSPSPSPSPSSRTRTSEPSTARQPTFAFPPLQPAPAATPRAHSRHHMRTPLSSSEDEVSDQHRRSARTPTYREVRNSRGLPDISIPPNPRTQLPTAGASPVRSPSPPLAPFPTTGGGRTDSIASGSSSSTIRRVRKVAVASPVNFHFPATSRTRSSSHSTVAPITPLPSSFQSPPSPVEVDVDTDIPPSASSPSPPSHQATHSLDNSNVLRRGPFGLSPSPAPHLPFSRAQSATPAGGRSVSGPQGAALSRGPSLNRQGSVAVMETVHVQPSVAPLRLAPRRNRSGSASASASGYRSEGEAGGLKVPPIALRDVLKMSPLPMNFSSGLGDLLPPSPSIVSPIHRPFTPHPPNTNLGNNVSGDHGHTPSHAHPFSALPGPTPDLHTHLDATLKPPPEIRPLDFMAFVASSEETHMELARTVDELSRWLAVVEGGLVGVLEKVAAGMEERHGIIQEELEGDEREKDLEKG